ncbi:hypothetical protein C0Q70_15141 [Pomacea canaliculata]|uniref:EGF-like domain-containing protein n=1 Tax=Pomacea canaliculata TaxID=400727 RepID=A0A2T7NU07_POMCA|nr:hypothetical protein C0Q70_15141 [Pomacea canaliculata]
MVSFLLAECEKDCDKGWYGKNCVETCGHCMGECDSGWYGTNCAETCGHCVGGNSTCDKINGSCPSCEGAFLPPLCKYKCGTGYYGDNCNQTCGHCVFNTTCDPDNGTCSSGCSEGYKEGLCVECRTGHYGENCSQLCGHCRQDTTCDPDNGTALMAAYWASNLVFVLNVILDFTVRTAMSRVDTVLSTPPVILLTVPAFQDVQMATEEIFVRVKLLPVNKAWYPLRMLTGNKPIVPVKPQTYHKPEDGQEVSDPHIYGNLREDTPTNSQLTSENTKSDDKNATTRKPQAKKEGNRQIYENVDLKKSLPTKPDDSQTQKPSAKSDKDPTDEGEESIYNTEDIYASYRSLGPSSILDDLQKSLLTSLASGN